MLKINKLKSQKSEQHTKKALITQLLTYNKVHVKMPEV